MRATTLRLIKAAVIVLLAIAAPYIWMQIGSGSATAPLNTSLPVLDTARPLLVLCMRAYVPTMTAGAEITSHVTNKYLHAAGWDIVVIVKHWAVPSYEGIPILPSLSSDPANYSDSPVAAAYLKAATAIGFQNIAFTDALAVAKQFKKPAVFFIHATSAGKDFFNYTGSWPIKIVYNSWTMMGDISAPYKSYVVKPWVDIDRFSRLRVASAPRKYVTLINLNTSKGGDFLIQLARCMPSVDFLGVRGGYGEQIEAPGVRNITYHPKTDQVEVIYNQTRVLLVPSDKETWGRVAVEAMAAGIPVIINDVPGLRECTGGAAIVARREDLATWQRQIERLLSTPSYYNEWSERGRKRARQLKDDTDMKGLGKFLLADK